MGREKIACSENLTVVVSILFMRSLNILHIQTWTVYLTPSSVDYWAAWLEFYEHKCFIQTYINHRGMISVLCVLFYPSLLALFSFSVICLPISNSCYTDTWYGQPPRLREAKKEIGHPTKLLLCPIGTWDICDRFLCCCFSHWKSFVFTFSLHSATIWFLVFKKDPHKTTCLTFNASFCSVSVVLRIRKYIWVWWEYQFCC